MKIIEILQFKLSRVHLVEDGIHRRNSNDSGKVVILMLLVRQLMPHIHSGDLTLFCDLKLKSALIGYYDNYKNLARDYERHENFRKK